MSSIKLNNLEVAVKVFSQNNGELSVKDIAVQAAAQGLLSDVTVDMFIPRLMASMSASVKRKDSPFVRVKNGKGGFKSGVYKLRKTRVKDNTSIPDIELSSDTGFVGCAGEHAVMSELLFHGFNTSLMTVDKGVDVVAADENGKYYHVQVKTSKEKNNSYQFSIKRKSFDSNHGNQTFYICVLRKNKSNNYLILPSSQIANYVALGVIRGVDSLNIRISYDSKVRKYVLNGKQDVTIFINRFGIIC